MYSVEYRCTKVETVNTTINIVYVRVSTEKFQFTSKRPDCTQVPRVTTVTSPLITALYLETRKVRAAHIEKIIKAASCFQITKRLNPSIKRKFNSGSSTMSNVMVFRYRSSCISYVFA